MSMITGTRRRTLASRAAPHAEGGGLQSADEVPSDLPSTSGRVPRNPLRPFHVTIRESNSCANGRKSSSPCLGRPCACRGLAGWAAPPLLSADLLGTLRLPAGHDLFEAA